MASSVSRSFFTIHHGIPEARNARGRQRLPVRVRANVCYTPEGWPQHPTYSGWGGSEDIARLYGPDGA